MTRRTVLIADDEPAVRKLVCRMLDKEYDVVEAQDGAEAVNLASSLRPDIIFMDMMMPEMNGLSACYAIKLNETTREIPVVMLTAISYELNKRLSEDVLGADGYITKPFTRESLLEEMGRVMRSGGDATEQAPHM
ncbi:MAG: PleD family two-component system response regulator [Dehalococcoidia bacterium]